MLAECEHVLAGCQHAARGALTHRFRVAAPPGSPEPPVFCPLEPPSPLSSSNATRRARIGLQRPPQGLWRECAGVSRGVFPRGGWAPSWPFSGRPGFLPGERQGAGGRGTPPCVAGSVSSDPLSGSGGPASRRSLVAPQPWPLPPLIPERDAAPCSRLLSDARLALVVQVDLFPLEAAVATGRRESADVDALTGPTLARGGRWRPGAPWGPERRWRGRLRDDKARLHISLARNAGTCMLRPWRSTGST